MSATASGGERRSGEDGQALRVYLWTVTVLVLGLLVGAAFHERASLVSQVQSMIAWACVVAVADLLPVWLMGRAVSFSVSLPVTLAAGMILGPLPAAIISTVGAMDPREIRREITPVRAAYNRAQVAASVWTASTVFHAFGVAITSWPLVVVPALAALVTDFAVNMTLVTVLTAWRLRLPVHTVPKRLLGESPLEYVSGYVSLGFIAALQALTFHVAGIWGLVAWLAPMGLTRQMFVQAQRLALAAQRIESKDRALVEATQRASEERRDERMVLAGELHDEILPPLFKVHLMGQVLRQDLSSGRLLDLDEDLPELLAATEVAQATVRGLVGGLRRSPIGAAGLSSTLRLFAEQLESAGAPTILLELDDVEGSYASQLLTYQVAREALSNAAKHSRATQIHARLWEEDASIRLVVQDDGIGFVADSVDANRHFGLQLLKERVEAASGYVEIDSRLGIGTTILVAIPVDRT
jgi:signal transduction histidine kinase